MLVALIVYPFIAIVGNNSPKLWNTCICTSLKLKGTRVCLKVWITLFHVANFLCLVAILCGPKFVQKFAVFSATNYTVESKYVVANGWNTFLQETQVLVPAIILMIFWYKVLCICLMAFHRKFLCIWYDGIEAAKWTILHFKCSILNLILGIYSVWVFWLLSVCKPRNSVVHTSSVVALSQPIFRPTQCEIWGSHSSNAEHRFCW